MDDYPASRLPYKLSDPRHQRIYRQLALVGPGAQAFFKDACQIKESHDSFEAPTHSIFHFYREIQLSLRDVLLIYAENTEIPDNDGLNWQLRQILKGLDVREDEPMAVLWFRNSRFLPKYAHRKGLDKSRPFNSEMKTFVSNMESVFDFVLSRFEAKYLTIFEALDKKLLVDNPTSGDVSWLQNYLPNNEAALQYFFSRLNNANWIPRLKNAGFFLRPPEPVKVVENERTFISYPTWPLSKFLVRMAAVGSEEVSAQVTEILVTIKTTNFIVHLDVVDAACALPIDFAERIAQNETLWLREQQFIGHLVPDRFADFTVYLADGGKSESALEIASVALSYVDIETHELSAAENYFGPEPRTRVERWDYGQFIQKSWRSLARADWLNSLRLFCSLLDEYLRRKYPERLESAESYSYIWHRSIDQDEDGIPNILVSTVRRVAELALADSSALPEIIEVLDSYKWDVFPRIALHVLRLHPSEAGEAIRTRLLTESNFQNLDLFHEYVLLLATFFNKLESDEQETVLAWIDGSAASLEEIKRRQIEWDGTELSDQEAEKTIRGSKLRWLEPLKEVLPDAWRKKYDAWTEELGLPPHPSYAIGVAQPIWGGEPPVSDVLSHLGSVEEVIDHLSLPEGELTDAPANLGRELGRLVQGNLQKFVPEAERFEGLAPVYVHGFISGVRSSPQSVPEDAWPSQIYYVL